MKKTLAWSLMTFLAFGVSGYAITILLVPEFRPPFAKTLFVERPASTIAHFLGGAVALVAGAFQLSAWFRGRYLNAHRWLGRLYVVAVIIGGIAGFFMALKAFGGLASNTGFGLLAVLWVSTTLNAYRLIRQGNVNEHRKWMIRSYALTLAAVTLRFYLPGSMIAGIPMTIAYPIIAWLCWVPNLLVAEWYIRSASAERRTIAAATLVDGARPG
jgi:uncharacterized membrane protein